MQLMPKRKDFQSCKGQLAEGQQSLRANAPGRSRALDLAARGSQHALLCPQQRERSIPSNIVTAGMKCTRYLQILETIFLQDDCHLMSFRSAACDSGLDNAR